MKIRLASALLSVLLAGCGRAPLPAEIEAVSMDASQRGDAAAEQRLQDWSADGLPVAERELALLYRKRHRDDQARALLLRAARQGDAEAAYALGEFERDHGRAAQWYRQAAQQGHAKAALGLALLLKHGDGIPIDKRAAAHCELERRLISILPCDLSARIDGNIGQLSFTEVSNARSQLEHSLGLWEGRAHPDPRHHRCAAQAESGRDLPAGSGGQSPGTRGQRQRQPVQAARRRASAATT
jgi:TPR repeat protein